MTALVTDTSATSAPASRSRYPAQALPVSGRGPATVLPTAILPADGSAAPAALAPDAVPGVRPVRAVRTAGPVSGRVWAYLGVVVGAVVSVAANVAHSYVRPSDLPSPALNTAAAGTSAGVWTPEAGAVIGATFWPIALLITTEIMVRTSWPPGRAWLLLRFLGLLPVAAVAGIVSYLHLHGLLQHYHEAPLTCLIAPLSVDGLMVMGSSALVAGTRTGSVPNLSAPDAGGGQVPAVSDAGDDADATISNRPVPVRREASPDVVVSVAVPARDSAVCEVCRSRPATVTWSRPAAGTPFRLCDHCTPIEDGHRPDTTTGPSTDGPSPRKDVRAPGQVGGRQSTSDAVLRMTRDDPDLPATVIADRLGVTARTVRRHLANHRTTAGHDVPDAHGPGQHQDAVARR